MIDELDKSDHALMDELLPQGASIEACRLEIAELAIRLMCANIAREDARRIAQRWRYAALFLAAAWVGALGALVTR